MSLGEAGRGGGEVLEHVMALSSLLFVLLLFLLGFHLVARDENDALFFFCRDVRACSGTSYSAPILPPLTPPLIHPPPVTQHLSSTAQPTHHPRSSGWSLRVLHGGRPVDVLSPRDLPSAGGVAWRKVVAAARRSWRWRRRLPRLRARFLRRASRPVRAGRGFAALSELPNGERPCPCRVC